MILLDKQLPTEIAQSVSMVEAIDIIGKLELELFESPRAGVGLSAPQIGINKAVAIIRIAPDIKINLVNPIITQVDGLLQYNEGCLSFPGDIIRTVRYKEITIEAMSEYEWHVEQITSKRYNREPIDIPLLVDERRSVSYFADNERSELLLVCLQHEISHLYALNMHDFEPEELGRNDKCPCNSGKKYKQCCLLLL